MKAGAACLLSPSQGANYRSGAWAARQLLLSRHVPVLPGQSVLPLNLQSRQGVAERRGKKNKDFFFKISFPAVIFLCFLPRPRGVFSGAVGGMARGRGARAGAACPIWGHFGDIWKQPGDDPARSLTQLQHVSLVLLLIRLQPLISLISFQSHRRKRENQKSEGKEPVLPSTHG